MNKARREGEDKCERCGLPPDLCTCDEERREAERMASTRVKGRTCPFKQGITLAQDGAFNRKWVVDERKKHCNGSECACWIEVVKPRYFVTAEHPLRKMKDEVWEYRYEGCGLVRVIPWVLVKR